MPIRLTALVSLLTAAAVAAAQGFPGAKADPVGSSDSAGAGGPGLGSLFNVLLALGLVYGILKFAAPKLMGRMNRKLSPGTGSDIRIEESATFAGGNLYVVSARGRSLLLSVGTGGVQCLADLTDPAPKAPEPPTFGDFVEQEIRAAAGELRAEPPDTDETPVPEDEWTSALARLERLERRAV